MTTIVTRTGKGSSLSWVEADANFTNLNTDKVENSAIVDMATKTGAETFTNKTINLSTNTVTGTLAQLNAAVSDADLVSLSGTETLTNKTFPESTNNIEFIPSGTGAVSTTVQSKLRESLSVKDFGSVGDGVTDDSAEIQAALDHLNSIGGGKLNFFPGSTYKINSGLTIYSNICIDLNGSTIDASGLVSADNYPRLFFGVGTYESINNLSSNASRGAFSVSATTSGYAKDDLVIVGHRFAFDASNTNTQAAEIGFIRSVVGTTVELQAPLVDSYTTANSAYVQKLVPVHDFKIYGGTIIGPVYDNVATGKAPAILQIHGGKNIQVSDVVFKKVSFAAVSLVDCVFSKITGCSFEESEETNELSYGISFGNASQDCVAIGNSFYNRRHSMTTNNFGAIGGYGASLRGITRRCKFAENVIYRSALYAAGSLGDAIDTHGGCEDIEILNNTIFYSTGNGINFEGRSGTIKGNVIYFAAAWGIRVHNETDFSGSVSIDGNKIMSAVSGGIYLQSGYRGGNKGFNYFSVCGNIISETGNVDGIYIDDASSANPYGVINSNVIAVGQNGIQINSTEKVTISGNSILSGNDCVSLASSNGYCSITGNTLESTLTAGRGVTLIASNKNSIVGNNITLPSGGTSSGILVTSTGTNGSSENTVTGNAVTFRGANTGYGVAIGNTYSSYNSVCSNVVRGANTGIDLGTGNVGNIQANNV